MLIIRTVLYTTASWCLAVSDCRVEVDDVMRRYWTVADRVTWLRGPALQTTLASDVDMSDENFIRFLRAISVRVIVYTRRRRLVPTRETRVYTLHKHSATL